MPGGVDLGSAYGSITIDASGTEKGMKDAKDQVQQLERSLTRAGLVAGAAGGILTGLATKATMTAARTQELGVVLENIANQTGNAMEEVNRQVDAVKDLGITTQVADRVLMKFMQNELDLTQATKLARLAQDAAVISMEDSSQALDGILHGILTLQPEVLRYRGIMVNLEQEYRSWAAENGRTVTSLTMLEKQNIALSAALEQGEKIAGTYDAAMGTAGKQMRSMSRHVEELQSALGEHLLPVMSDIVQAGTDVLKWARALPEPIQRTGIQVAGFGGAMLTATGIIVALGPKVMSLLGTFSSLAASIGMSTTALLAPLGLIAALGTVALYVSNAERQHREMAGQIASSATTYDDYIEKLEDEELAHYAIAESLYEEAKARGMSDEEMRDLINSADDLVGKMGELRQRQLIGEFAGDPAAEFANLRKELAAMVPVMTDSQLQLARNRQEMTLLFQQAGFGAEMSSRLADSTVKLAEAEHSERWQTELLNRAMKSTADTYTILEEERTKNIGAAKRAAEAEKAAAAETQAALEALAEAVETIRDRYESLFGTLAQGIVGIRRLDQQAADSAEDYQDRLDELDDKAGRVYSDVKVKFEASLPSATTVAERLKMTEDAWDEWALRLDAIIASGAGSEWYDDLVEKMGEPPPDVGVKEWAADLKAQFEAGELPELINTQAEAWIENTAKMKQAQQEATQAYNEEVAKRKAAIEEEKQALQEAREEELAQEAEARKRAVLEMALQIAESTQTLQQWSRERFGPDFSQVGDSAAEVLALLDSGMIDLDDTLRGIIENNVAGVQTVLNTTGEMAEGTKEQLAGILDTDFVAEMEQKAADMWQAVAVADPRAKADAQAAAEEMGDAIEDEMPKTPFDPLLGNFKTAQQDIMTGIGGMETEWGTALSNMGIKSDTIAGEIVDQWLGNSVIPDIITGVQGMGTEWATMFEGVDTGFATTKGAAEDFLKVIDDLVAALRELKRLLSELDTTEHSPPPAATGLQMTADAAYELAQTIGNELGTALLRASGNVDELATKEGELRDRIEELRAEIEEASHPEGNLEEVERLLAIYEAAIERNKARGDDEEILRKLANLEKKRNELLQWRQAILTGNAEVVAQLEAELADVEAQLEEILHIQELMEQVDIGRSLGSIGQAFANWYTEANLEPLLQQMADLDRAIEEYKRILGIANEEEDERVTRLGEINEQIEHLSQFGSPQALEEMAQLEEERAAIMAELAEELADLEAQKAEAAEEYAEQQERILALQEEQKKLDLLGQQLQLLQLISDYGLDPSILSGIPLGLGADMGASIDAMTEAMRVIVEALNAELSGMQGGGPVYPGESYIVGERGPELFSPTTAGTVWPNDVLQELSRIADLLGTPRNGGSVSVYGGLNLAGVTDGRSLLGELARLRVGGM